MANSTTRNEIEAAWDAVNAASKMASEAFKARDAARDALAAAERNLKAAKARTDRLRVSAMRLEDGRGSTMRDQGPAPSITITHYIDSSDTALLGDGLTPAGWAEDKADHVARLRDMTEAAIRAACPGCEVEVVSCPGGRLPSTTVGTLEDIGSTPRMGLEDATHEASQTAWVAWTEALPEAE